MRKAFAVALVGIVALAGGCSMFMEDREKANPTGVVPTPKVGDGPRNPTTGVMPAGGTRQQQGQTATPNAQPSGIPTSFFAPGSRSTNVVPACST